MGGENWMNVRVKVVRTLLVVDNYWTNAVKVSTGW